MLIFISIFYMIEKCLKLIMNYKLIVLYKYYLFCTLIECHKVFALMVRSNQELKEKLFSFTITDEEVNKTNYLRTLCRQMANTVCKADAVSHNICLTYVTFYTFYFIFYYISSILLQNLLVTACFIFIFRIRS